MTAGDTADERRYLNRELSWLHFNGRVLALAEDASLPLLERAKFLAIFSRNLDEFFQIRVAILLEEHESGIKLNSVDGMSPLDQLIAIREQVLELTRVEQAIFDGDLRPALGRAGIEICGWDDLGSLERKELTEAFDARMFPVLTPLAVDPAHPFPYVSNLSFNLAVMVRHPTSGMVRFARIKIPSILERFVPLACGGRFVPVEQVIAAHLDRFFPEMVIESHSTFRVTRDADLDIREDEADDLLMAVESGLQRQRSSDAVRLEVDEAMPAQTRDMLLRELELGAEDLYVRRGLIGLGDLWQLYELDLPELKDPQWIPRPVPAFARIENENPDELFGMLREGDVLVHHPYDSFDQSVEAFLATAAADPAVLAIKHTIYRTSGPENRIGRVLRRAAQSGKQVVTLVELKARFEERANIEWARKLEEAGVHVVYGLVGLKTHAKLALVVRRESDGIRRYCHVGTGNYNPLTARTYEDVGIFSASPDLGADLSELFNHLTGFNRETTYRQLLVAPHGLRDALLEQIAEEMEAPDGEIFIKVNNLSDPKMIDALYAASDAGVKIELVVRAICCLRAGVPGLSENIRVRSVLGRFLEHSRIYRFGSEARGRRYWMGSADLMPRNLDRRVEALVPVVDTSSKQRLEEILPLLMEVGATAWDLHDTTWRRAEPGDGPNVQAELQRRALERSGSE